MSFFGGRDIEFQFPSNGKVYSETELKEKRNEILFQFPSNGKVYSELETADIHNEYLLAFQFPSNGKVYSEKMQSNLLMPISMVSIPFKRESVFRVKSTTTETEKKSAVFQFPSNGKVYSETALVAQVKNLSVADVFQFPSNGKVYSESQQETPSGR